MRDKKYRSWNDFLNVFAYFENGKYWYYYNGTFFDNGWNAFDWNNAEQYTGLKDRNSKEIYEGDIMIYADIHHTVEENMGCFIAVPLWDSDYSPFVGNINNHSEIIGNIHQNPELLQN